MEERAENRSSVPIHGHAQQLVEHAREIATRFRITPLNRQIEACERLFFSSGLIDVAILGQFKAGKSSFINSLVGQVVLPVGVIPVTTVITRLRYGPEPRARVNHFDGTEAIICLEELEGFVSEAKNPGNERNVEVVDIELPALATYEGLRLVDTPSLGSVFRHNTATSEEWFPSVGAAMVAISSDRPLSENDVALIRELATYTPNIVLLLTKVDLLTDEQRKEVVKFFKETVRRSFGRDLPVFLYSTTADTQLYRRWVDRFLIGLSNNRDTEFSSIILHKVQSLVKGTLGYLDIALSTSMQADRERDELKALILDEQVNYDLMRRELFFLAREQTEQTRSLIAARLETRRAEFTRAMVEKLRTDMATWRGNLWRLTRRYEDWLAETLSVELPRLSEAEQRHFYGTLDKAHAAISRSLEFFRGRLAANLQRVLSITLEKTEWSLDVEEPGQPDVQFTKAFDVGLDVLWFVIPMVVFRPAFEKHFLKQVPGVVQVHFSRLAYQWEVRINRGIEGIREQALAYVRDELSTIDALLSQVSGQTEEIRRISEELRNQFVRLSETR